MGVCAEKAARPPRFLRVRAGARLSGRADSESAELLFQFADGARGSVWLRGEEVANDAKNAMGAFDEHSEQRRFMDSKNS